MAKRSILHAAGLAALALLLGAAPAPAQVNWDAWKPKDTGPLVYPEILVTPEALAAALAGPGTVVVDARPADAFAAAHVPGARSFPARTAPLDPRVLVRALAAAGVPSTGTVVAYGDATDPAAAGRLFWLLESAGHPAVRVLNGGLEAWRESRPVESGMPVAVAARFDARPDSSRIADFAAVMRSFGRAGHSVLDPRPAETWAAGMVPHSLPFPLEKLVDERGRLRDGPDIRPIFAEWGPRPHEYVSLDDTMIVMGGDAPGELPVHPYLAARVAGIAAVRVYDGGFADWRAHEEAPIVRIVGAEEVRSMLRASWGGDPEPYPPPDLLLFDLRGWREYAVLGHIPGALWLPAHRFDADLDAVVADFWPGIDRARAPVVVYCYGPTCTRSRNCSTMAAQHGFRRLYWFKDGTDAWRNLGEPLIKTESP